MRWLPRWVAEAVAVPLAAQVACTPVVAAISGQVSLVAVAANLLVAAAVGPATVLGLVAGLFVLAWEPLGLLVGRLAGACAWWIVAVAEHSASLPAAAVGWSSSGLAIAVLAALCLVCVLVMPALLGRRWWALAAVVALVVAVLRPWPGAGWPPPGWVMVVCDVGQGDGIVLNAGTGAAVVVDAGPDADAMDDCLERLGVRRLPVVVLTHFHADHVAGLTGAMAGRDVGEILVTALQEPAGGAHEVGSVAVDAGVPVRTASYGEVRRIGPLTWQVIGPSRELATGSGSDAGSAPNNASLVVLAQVRGVRLLLGADMEPEAQRLLARSLPDLRADVLKVPHHGSRYQDPDLLGDLGATLAVISVGAANDYGHPAPETMALLDEAGMLVRRTDESGDIAVVVDGDGELRVVTRGRSRSPPQ
jgi:competence protein ComEC